MNVIIERYYCKLKIESDMLFNILSSTKIKDLTIKEIDILTKGLFNINKQIEDIISLL